MHCKYAQGFFFSRPVEAGDIEKMLATLAASPDADGLLHANLAIVP
jgi:hypothetical protein